MYRGKHKSKEDRNKTLWSQQCCVLPTHSRSHHVHSSVIDWNSLFSTPITQKSPAAFPQEITRRNGMLMTSKCYVSLCLDRRPSGFKSVGPQVLRITCIPSVSSVVLNKVKKDRRMLRLMLQEYMIDAQSFNITLLLINHRWHLASISSLSWREAF